MTNALRQGWVSAPKGDKSPDQGVPWRAPAITGAATAPSETIVSASALLLPPNMPPKTWEHPSASDRAHGEGGTQADGGDRQQIHPPKQPSTDSQESIRWQPMAETAQHSREKSLNTERNMAEARVKLCGFSPAFPEAGKGCS